MNKIAIFYLGIALVVLLAAFLVLTANKSPDELILGQWKEVSWEYEKVNKNHKDSSSFLYSMSQHIAEEIVKDLIIHESEVWDIKEDGTLLLAGKDGDKHIYNWRLKGWGNILKLLSDTHQYEYYQIAELNSEKLVLVFENDLQVRGVVKITFEKIRR